MTRQEWEDDLLMEFEGLDRLAKSFAGIDLILERWVEEYSDYTDPNLVMLVEMIRFDLNITLNGTVNCGDIKVPGVLAQLEDVADEVQTLQAGLPTKEAPGENLQEDDE